MEQVSDKGLQMQCHPFALTQRDGDADRKDRVARYIDEERRERHAGTAIQAMSDLGPCRDADGGKQKQKMVSLPRRISLTLPSQP